MKKQFESVSHRILVVDDNPAIHADFRKILCPVHNQSSDALASMAEDLFGDIPRARVGGGFEMDSAFQGQEAFAKVQQAEQEGRPYEVAFMDVRMPPGWDGIETIARIWKDFPQIQIVICTAYSDYSLDQVLRTLGETDSLVALKKPFDNVEVLQLAHTLTKKWAMTRQANARMTDLDHMVHDRTHELLETNHKLQAEIRRRSAVELELRDSEERFRKAFEVVSVPLCIRRVKDGHFLDANRTFLSLTGYSRAEILGSTLEELNLLAEEAQHERVQQKLQDGGRVRNAEMTIRQQNGEIRQTLMSIEPLELGEQDCLLSALLDVTEERKLESQLRQAQKMEAVGQLATGVAHDFNNLLTVIHGYTSLQLAKRNLEADVSRAFTQVRDATERATALTRQLLTFSRKTVLQRKQLDLAKVLAKMQHMLARLVGETIRLKCAFSPELPFVQADETNLEQVMMNLVINARDAMPNGGQVNVELRARDLGPADVVNYPDRRAGSFLVLKVADTGCGMNESTLSRIFEPFFTTKSLGRGTGLGLSTVYGIVKQHEGWIEVKSTPGIGTTFRIFLPSVQNSAGMAESVPAVEAAIAREAGGLGETIMVVEDEESLREMVASALINQGYRVVQAASGAEALDLWAALERPAQLLFSDLVLEDGVTGPWLAGRLLHHKPDLQIIYTSGYNPETLPLEKDWKEGADYLPKPFTQEHLLNCVREALANEPMASPVLD